jgi:hypothetical protein
LRKGGKRRESRSFPHAVKIDNLVLKMRRKKMTKFRHGEKG